MHLKLQTLKQNHHLFTCGKENTPIERMFLRESIMFKDVSWRVLSPNIPVINLNNTEICRTLEGNSLEFILCNLLTEKCNRIKNNNNKDLRKTLFQYR